MLALVYVCIHKYTRVCTFLFCVYFVCFLIAKIVTAPAADDTRFIERCFKLWSRDSFRPFSRVP